MRVPGLDQHTNTNAESLHYSHKNGEDSVCAGMSTVTSCNVQATKAEKRSQKMAKYFAQQIGRNNVQEDSDTRDFLTPFAEEMMCHQRNQMDDYWIVQVSKTKFLMMKPRCIDADKIINGSQIGKLE